MKLALKQRHFLKDLLRCATFSIVHYPFSIQSNKFQSVCLRHFAPEEIASSGAKIYSKVMGTMENLKQNLSGMA